MPVIDTAEAPAPEVEAPRPSPERGEDRRGQRSGHDRRPSEPRAPSEARAEPRAEPRAPAEHRSQDDRRYPQRGTGERVVGMGDHVPDFILRSFAIKSAPVEETEEEDAESQA